MLILELVVCRCNSLFKQLFKVYGLLENLLSYPFLFILFRFHYHSLVIDLPLCLIEGVIHAVGIVILSADILGHSSSLCLSLSARGHSHSPPASFYRRRPLPTIL